MAAQGWRTPAKAVKTFLWLAVVFKAVHVSQHTQQTAQVVTYTRGSLTAKRTAFMPGICSDHKRLLHGKINPFQDTFSILNAPARMPTEISVLHGTELAR